MKVYVEIIKEQNMLEERNEYGFPLAAEMDDDIQLDLELAEIDFDSVADAELMLMAELANNEPQIAVQDDYDGYADLYSFT